MKPLRLSYELSWRTKEDEKFTRSASWKKIRLAVLKRDDDTCQYCGFRSDKRMNINHIDGNPKNNDEANLETVCQMCHMIMHSGLWCATYKVIDLYLESKYSQNDIIRITREMREKGKSDNEIVKFLGLRKPTPWRQDLKYLANLFGFISSRKPQFVPSRAYLTEQQQKDAIRHRDKW